LSLIGIIPHLSLDAASGTHKCRENFSGVHQNFSGVRQIFSGVRQIFSGVRQIFSAIHQIFSGVHQIFSDVRQNFSAFFALNLAIALNLLTLWANTLAQEQFTLGLPTPD
jgi:methyl-accepting chemotaxis protein